MNVPPIYRLPVNWQTLMQTHSPDQLKMLLEIYNQLQTLINQLNPALQVTEIAVAADVAALGNTFLNNTIVAVLGVDAVGDIVPISTLLDAPAFTNGSAVERVGIMAAINNTNMANNDNLINWANIVNTNIELNFVVGHGLQFIMVVYGPSTNG